MRPIKGQCIGWFTKGSDGCVHAEQNEPKKNRKNRKRSKPYNIEYAYDCECCEHCPYPDCMRSGKKPCLTLITYDDYIWCSDWFANYLINGNDIKKLRSITGITILKLQETIDQSKFPNENTQKLMIKFMEVHRK